MFGHSRRQFGYHRAGEEVKHGGGSWLLRTACLQMEIWLGLMVFWKLRDAFTCHARIAFNCRTEENEKAYSSQIYRRSMVVCLRCVEQPTMKVYLEELMLFWGQRVVRPSINLIWISLLFILSFLLIYGSFFPTCLKLLHKCVSSIKPCVEVRCLIREFYFLIKIGWVKLEKNTEEWIK